MNLRELLQRFRPMGISPVGILGAASRPGVLADRGAELALEEQEHGEGVRHRWAAEQQGGDGLGR
jgi:hypothetical protein